MNKELIVQMQSQFDALAQTHPEATDLEFWFARDLQEPLGYARWENFLTAIQRAIESCKTTGYNAEHHFRGLTKMVELGSGAKRPVEDFMLTLTIAETATRRMTSRTADQATSLTTTEESSAVPF